MNASKIRNLNDVFRQTFIGGQVMLTSGVNALPSDSKTKLLYAVKTHSDFTEGNDPNGEHDFGSCDIAGEKFFWKIDYYDVSMEFGSPNPSDPAVTRRVLTVMHSDEY